MAITYYVGSLSTGYSGAFGFFFKFPTNPASDTIIGEINATGSGYHRVVLKSDGTLYAQTSYGGSTASNQIGSGAAVTSSWYWVSCSTYQNYGSATVYAVTEVWNPDGSTFGTVVTNPPANFNQTWSISFSLGTSISNPSLANWPNTTGYEISKAYINGELIPFDPHGAYLINPPTIDWRSAPATAFGA